MWDGGAAGLPDTGALVCGLRATGGAETARDGRRVGRRVGADVGGAVYLRAEQ